MISTLDIQSRTPTPDGNRIIFTKKAPSAMACAIKRRTPKGAVLQFASTFAIPSRFVLEVGPSRTRHSCIEVERCRTAIEVEFVPSATASPANMDRAAVLRALRSRRVQGR